MAGDEEEEAAKELEDDNDDEASKLASRLRDAMVGVKSLILPPSCVALTSLAPAPEIICVAPEVAPSASVSANIGVIDGT